jgi:5-methylcytosine-specific restriction endonuclease McrA
MPCQLCDRAIDDLTEHHLVPRQYTRRRKLPTSDTVLLCRPCHKHIHTLFDNATLARELNTLASYRQNPGCKSLSPGFANSSPTNGLEAIGRQSSWRQPPRKWRWCQQRGAPPAPNS